MLTKDIFHSFRKNPFSILWTAFCLLSPLCLLGSEDSPPLPEQAQSNPHKALASGRSQLPFTHQETDWDSFFNHLEQLDELAWHLECLSHYTLNVRLKKLEQKIEEANYQRSITAGGQEGARGPSWLSSDLQSISDEISGVRSRIKDNIDHQKENIHEQTALLANLKDLHQELKNDLLRQEEALKTQLAELEDQGEAGTSSKRLSAIRSALAYVRLRYRQLAYGYDRINTLETQKNILKYLYELNFDEGIGSYIREVLANLPPLQDLEETDGRLEDDEIVPKEQSSWKSPPDQNLFNAQARTFDRTDWEDHSFSINIPQCQFPIVKNELKKEYKKAKGARKRLNFIYTHYCFWMRDFRPIRLTFFIACIRQTKDFLKRTSNTIKNLKFDGKREIILLISLIFTGLFFRYFVAPKYRKYQSEVQSRIGKVTRDKFSLSIGTLLYALLMASKPMLILYCFAFYLKSVSSISKALSSSEIASFLALSESVRYTAYLVFILQSFYFMAQPQGLLVDHFRWNPEKLQNCLKGYPIKSMLLCYSFLWGWFFSSHALSRYTDTLGRLHFITLCLTLINIKYNSLRAESNIDFWFSSKSKGSTFIWLLLLAIPIFTIYSVILGYFSSAQGFLYRVELSLLIWFIFGLFYYLFFRFLFIQRRRIAFDRARQRRSEILASRSRAAGEEGVVEGLLDKDIEEPVIDLENISSRALQLARSIIGLFGTIFILLAVWSSIYPVLYGMGEAYFPAGFSVLTVLESALITFICYQLYNNLPALLELVIFPYFDLTRNTRCTIKNVLSYAILILGFILIFWELDLGRWLILFQVSIATFTGAVGFGLRDPILSLFSSLLLLTTRKVRIGDMVLINGVSGTVDQIDALTTTLIDTERREYSIPNKDFLMEKFCLWNQDEGFESIQFEISLPTTVEPLRVLNLLENSVKKLSGTLESRPPEMNLVQLIPGVQQIYEIKCYMPGSPNPSISKNECYNEILKDLVSSGIEALKIQSLPKERKIDESS